jgi:hypothetical protein
MADGGSGARSTSISGFDTQRPGPGGTHDCRLRCYHASPSASSGWARKCGGFPLASIRREQPRRLRLVRRRSLGELPAARHGGVCLSGHGATARGEVRPAQDLLRSRPALRADRLRWRGPASETRGEIGATDFFSVEVLTRTSLVRYFVLFIIDLQTRRVEMPGLASIGLENG